MEQSASCNEKQTSGPSTARATSSDQPAQTQEETEEQKPPRPVFPLPWGGFAFFDRPLSLKDDEAAWKAEHERNKEHTQGESLPLFALLELTNVALR